MYNETLDVRFGQPKQVCTTEHHEHVRDVVVSFETEFSPQIAHVLGYEHDHQDLVDGGKPKVEYELGAVRCAIDVTAAKVSHQLKNCVGVGAVAKRAGKETKKNPEPRPTITFAFRTHWEDKDILAIAHCFGQRGAVRIEKMQTALLDDEGKPTTVKKRKGKK